MIKAIIFDCFGVLVTESWNPFKDRHFSNNIDKYNEAGRLMDMSNEGLMTHQQFLTTVGELAEISSAQVDDEIRDNSPNEKLFELISTLKKNYKIGFLSNVASNFLNELFSEEQVLLFDVVALSCDLKLIKPDPQIYIETAKLLDCQPKECLFVDDTKTYIAGAKLVGMRAIQYKEFNSFRAEFDSILEMTNTDK